MSKRFAFVLMILALLTLTGCAARSAVTENFAGKQGAGLPMATMAPAAVAEAPRQSAGISADMALPASAPLPAEVVRLVIQNADLAIAVDDPSHALDVISRMASDMGGFVVTSALYKSTTKDGVENPEANITIRVPAEKLNDALDQIKALVKNPVTDILNENKSGQDVTKDYTDLKSRLSNLEDTEKQLREIMASATKTEDVMMVFNQLTQIREQIEIIKGQMKYYEESARLSAISVSIKASAAVAPLTIGKWQPVGVARDAIQALIDVLKFLANMLIWVLLLVAPIFLLFFIPIRLIIGAVRRSKAKHKTAAPPPPPAA